jgi:ABC-type amino acid transport substrate-binding protein
MATSCSKISNKDLVVGISPDYPPFAFEYKNELIGFDIDLISAISERLGYSVKFKKMEFDDLLPAIENKKIDLVISSVTQTQDRLEKFDFSHSYYTPTFALVFKKDKIKNIEVLEDLDGVIGVENRTTMSDFLERRLDNMRIEDEGNSGKNAKSVERKALTTRSFLIKKDILMNVGYNENITNKSNESEKSDNQKVEEKKEFEIKLYPKHLDLTRGLENNEIDAVLVETLQAEVLTQNNHKLSYINVPYNEDGSYYYGVVFPKNSKITHKFNKVLDEIDSEGKIDILRLRWFSGYGIYSDSAS